MDRPEPTWRTQPPHWPPTCRPAVGRTMLGGRPTRRARVGCGAILLVLAGCEAGSGAPERAVPSPRLPAVQGEGDAPADRAAPPTKTTTERAVEWRLAEPIDREARAALTTEAISAVDRSPVPVLVPAPGDCLRNAHVMVGPHWFAYASSDDGLTLSVRGTRLAHRYSGIAPAEGKHRVRDAAAFASQDQGIWSVSWREHGLAYSLDVECATADDARCADETYALGVAAELRYVGGQGSSVRGAVR